MGNETTRFIPQEGSWEFPFGIQSGSQIRNISFLNVIRNVLPLRCCSRKYQKSYKKYIWFQATNHFLSIVRYTLNEKVWAIPCRASNASQFLPWLNVPPLPRQRDPRKNKIGGRLGWIPGLRTFLMCTSFYNILDNHVQCPTASI